MKAVASLEAQVANIADELAYNAHDLDDGLQAGLIQPEQLDGIALWQTVAARVTWHGGPLNAVTRHHIIRELVGSLVDDVLRQSARLINAAGLASPEDAQQCPQPLIAHSPDMARQNRQLKDFLFENMYRHYKIVAHAEARRKLPCRSLRKLPARAAPAARCRPRRAGRMRGSNASWQIISPA